MIMLDHPARKPRQRPTREQMLTCTGVVEVMRKYRISHDTARRLMHVYGIDYGWPHTTQRVLENEQARYRLALTIRRLKSQGISDQNVAKQLGISLWNVQQARREYDIGRADRGEYHG